MSADDLNAVELLRDLPTALPAAQSGTVLLAVKYEAVGMKHDGTVQYGFVPMVLATPDLRPEAVSHAVLHGSLQAIANIPPCECEDCTAIDAAGAAT